MSAPLVPQILDICFGFAIIYSEIPLREWRCLCLDAAWPRKIRSLGGSLIRVGYGGICSY